MKLSEGVIALLQNDGTMTARPFALFAALELFAMTAIQIGQVGSYIKCTWRVQERQVPTFSGIESSWNYTGVLQVKHMGHGRKLRLTKQGSTLHAF